MRCRRDYRDLSPAEKARFVAALHHVKANGVVDAFAAEHSVHFSHGRLVRGFGNGHAGRCVPFSHHRRRHDDARPPIHARTDAYRRRVAWRQSAAAPPNDPGQRFCHIAHCLLKQNGVLELLKRNGIDPTQIARCLEGICRHDHRDGDPLLRLKSLLNDGQSMGMLVDALRHLDIAHK